MPFGSSHLPWSPSRIRSSAAVRSPSMSLRSIKTAGQSWAISSPARSWQTQSRCRHRSICSIARSREEPMRIETYQAEATVDALADRLFANAAPEVRAALKDRLRALNPQLGSTLTLPFGAPLVVPEDDGGDADPAQARILAEITALLDTLETRHRSAVAGARAAVANS